MARISVPELQPRAPMVPLSAEHLRELMRRATPGEWKLCYHLADAEADRKCPCGFWGDIWGPDGNHVVCSIGVPHSGSCEELSPPRYAREVELANAALITYLVAHASEIAALLEARS